MINFQRVETKFFPEHTHFRPRTPMQQIQMAFIFVNGGMGDYICWIPAIEWLMSETPWIRGTLVIPKYFRELAEYWITNPEWKFIDYKETFNNETFNNMAFRGPIELPRESLNATGAHLLTCGWVYFTNREKAPEGWDRYPRFKPEDLAKVELPAEAKNLGRYAVVTIGQTTNSRKSPPGAWNPVIEHLRDRGLTPVFLGRSVMETGNANNIRTQFGAETRIDLGVNLLDKTSLIQAAAIMQGAEMVIGHDNGLLHLAGCTETPIIFGYNIASPEHRRPRRTKGEIYDVFLTESELACTFCQSYNNFLIGQNYRECFYGDLVCMKRLFEDGTRRWKERIDECLSART